MKPSVGQKTEQLFKSDQTEELEDIRENQENLFSIKYNPISPEVCGKRFFFFLEKIKKAPPPETLPPALAF